MIVEPAMPNVTEINRPEQLEELRLIWSLLVPQTRNASLFHTLDWLQTYWKHFGEGQKLRVLVVSSGHQPIGILPLVVVKEKTRLGWIRVLTYPLRDWGSFFSPIGPNPTATLTLAFQHIRQTPRDWDLLDLRWIDRDQDDHMRTPWAIEHAGFTVGESVWKTTDLIELSEDWDHYWQSRSSKMRNNLRRDEKRLRRRGTIEHIRYRPGGTALGDDDPRWDLFDTCVEIARNSWQGTSETGTTLCHERVAEFFRDVHALAVKHGMVDLNLLLVNGKPVAFSYNYLCRGNLIGVRRGQLRCAQGDGAGNVLLRRMLQDSFERGDARLDLGPGYREVKRRWSTRSVASYHYTHYPWGAPRVQLLRLKHWWNRDDCEPVRQASTASRTLKTETL